MLKTLKDEKGVIAIATTPFDEKNEKFDEKADVFSMGVILWEARGPRPRPSGSGTCSRTASGLRHKWRGRCSPPRWSRGSVPTIRIKKYKSINS